MYNSSSIFFLCRSFFIFLEVQLCLPYTYYLQYLHLLFTLLSNSLCQWVISVFTSLTNEMERELPPEDLLRSPAVIHIRLLLTDSGEAAHPPGVGTGTAVTPSGRGNGKRVIQGGNRSHDTYAELETECADAVGSI